MVSVFYRLNPICRTKGVFYVSQASVTENIDLYKCTALKGTLEQQIRWCRCERHKKIFFSADFLENERFVFSFSKKNPPFSKKIYIYIYIFTAVF